MIKQLLLVISFSLAAMNNDTKIDIEKSHISESQETTKCECRLCKGMKIVIGSNLISIVITAAATALINYSQCSK